MDIKLIPFGLRVSDLKLADVSEVAAGIACNCICPSCNVPLIARKGDVNQWHFAHSSKGVYENAIDKCEYSYYVSLRMMLKQIIVEQTCIVTIPPCIGKISGRRGRCSEPFTEYFPVSNTQKISLKDVSVEVDFLNTSVDVLVDIKGFKLVCYFTYPGRTIPESLKDPDSEKCGVVVIDLSYFYESGNNKDQRTGGLKEELTRFICGGEGNKWIYHPRLEKQKAHALKILNEMYGDSVEVTECSYLNDKFKGQLVGDKVRFVGGDKEEVSRMALFKCNNCGDEWQEIEYGLNKCERCNTHLYRTVVRYLG